MADAEAIVKAMEEAGIRVESHDPGEESQWLEAQGWASAFARFRGVPLDEVEALTILAEGCPKHPSYRAKRKVNTICDRCNEMWEVRQRLHRLRGGDS